jgi:hypothetical protein
MTKDLIAKVTPTNRAINRRQLLAYGAAATVLTATTPSRANAVSWQEERVPGWLLDCGGDPNSAVCRDTAEANRQLRELQYAWEREAPILAAAIHDQHKHELPNMFLARPNDRRRELWRAQFPNSSDQWLRVKVVELPLGGGHNFGPATVTIWRKRLSWGARRREYGAAVNCFAGKVREDRSLRIGDFNSYCLVMWDTQRLRTFGTNPPISSCG